MPRDSRLYLTFPIDFWTHHKVEPLSDAAFRAFVELNGHSRMHQLDGIIPARFAEHKWGRETLAELIESDDERPLLIRDGKAYVIRDYAEHQFTKADLEKLRADKARAGRASAAARAGARTGVQQTIEQNVNTTQLGTETGLGTRKPSSNEEGSLSPFCYRHRPSGTERPCKPCGTARLAYEAAKTAEKNKPTPTPTRDPECDRHPGYPLPCHRCAEDAVSEVQIDSA